jgi:hypothetical protein
MFFPIQSSVFEFFLSILLICCCWFQVIIIQEDGFEITGEHIEEIEVVIVVWKERHVDIDSIE